MPLARPVNRLLRRLWSTAAPSRSTWFDSRRWRAVWNVNRFFMATPRAERTLVQVQFAPSMRMELDLSRLTDVLAFCYGPGENEVGHACAQLVPPDGIVADVGGNIGTTTLSFAASVPNGQVHVFEPSRDMLSILRNNLALSGVRNVIVHGFGLADAPSRGHLQVATAGNPGSAFFVDDAQQGERAEADDIEVRRLDDVLASVARLDFVKIDVEGYELRVLRGASALLQRHRPAVLFEVNEAALRRAGTSGREVCDFLLGHGYRLRYLHCGRFRDYDPATMLSRKLHNVIAVAANAGEPGG